MNCKKMCKLMQVAVTEQDVLFKLSWLSLEKNNLSLQKLDISCCQGDSGYFEDKANVYVHCPLNARWQAVQDLLEQTNKNSPEQAWQKLWNHQHLLGTLPTLKKLITCHEKNKSVVVESSSPSQMLIFALEAIWLYGAHIVMIDFSHSKRVNSFYHMFETFKQKNAGYRPIVVISQLKKLWDSQNASDFEGMLSFCYQHGFIVWAEFVNDATSQSDLRIGATDARRSKRLLDRVQQIRTNSFYNWLSSSCRSQLSEMTGDAKYIQINEARTRLPNNNNLYSKDY